MTDKPDSAIDRLSEAVKRVRRAHPGLQDRLDAYRQRRRDYEATRKGSGGDRKAAAKHLYSG